MIKEIVTDLNKLSDRCEEIDIRKDNELMREIIISLKDTLREHKDGVGLAAPQIGYDKRIFVINFNGDLRTFINPIISEANNLTLNRESCLSLPGKSYIRPRHSKITVVYQTPLGKVESRQMFGLAACVFQHELDHLDGLTLNDIGLEVGKEFDEATEEERDQVLQAYLDSLDLKQKELDKEIEEDDDLKKQVSAIKFMEKLQKGEIEVEVEQATEEQNKEINEKINKVLEAEKANIEE